MPDPRKSRLQVGVDVPWVTSWSAEQIRGIGPCASVDDQVAVLQAELPQYDQPVYSKNHFRRQRASVQKMLCPMCGAPTRSGDRWSQTGKHVPAGVMRARRLSGSIPASVPNECVILDAGAISPGHLACMSRSLQQCPHLRGLSDRELKLFPSRWHITATMLNAVVTSQADALDPGTTASQTFSAIGFLQLCGITERIDPNWRRMIGTD